MDHVYALKHASGFVGLQHLDRSYVVGFRSRLYAYRVRDTVHPDMRIKLQKHSPEDVGSEVNFGLKHLGVGINIDERITIDTRAELFVPMKTPHASSKNSPVIDVVAMEESDFMTMPFSKRIGVVCAHALLEEDDDHAVFLSDVIDPLSQYDMFRAFLE